MSTQQNKVAAPKGRQMVNAAQRMQTVRDLMEQYKPQLQMALPKHLSADRMLRVMLTEVARTPQLQRCTPASLIGCLLECGQLGLEPGVLGHAYLIPYKNKGTHEATLIIGYKGLVQLARNSGQVLLIKARVVREGDMFAHRYGLERDEIEHTPADPSAEAIAAGWKPGALTHVYAVAHLEGGGIQSEVMNRAEVMAIKERSRASSSGPWKTDEAEMWKKTALRRLCKLLPASIELQRAVALDELADAGVPQKLGVVVDVPPPPPAKPAAQIEDGDEDPEPESPAEEPASAEAGAIGFSSDTGVCPDCERHREFGHADDCAGGAA